VNQGVEEVVNLPVRASIGRTFMVAKLHLFGFLLNVVAKQGYLSDEQEEEILSCYHSILFALMAEDLYITIISDANGQESWAKRATHDLVMMWEERSAVSTIAFAPLLQELWDARHLLIPVLGTLMGTVELLQLSMGLSRTWHARSAPPWNNSSCSISGASSINLPTQGDRSLRYPSGRGF